MLKLNFFIHRTAAALAFKLNKKVIEKTVLAFSFGGGSVDVSLLSIDQGVFEVVATSGDPNIGGEDFDERMMNFLLEKYKNTTGRDIRFEYYQLLFTKEKKKNYSH